MIRKTLFLGTGGCGSKLTNALMELSSIVNGAFINSNINEMKKLSKFDVNSSNYLFINGEGTGRNPVKAEELLERDKTKVAEFVRMHLNYTTVVILFSTDGGFGSGSVQLLCKAFKNMSRRLGNEIAVNLIGVCPKFNNRKINLENTLWAKDKIKKLRAEGLIDSYIFINNNKMEGRNESDFNKEVMKSIYNAYTINYDELDPTDAGIINNTKGYKAILELDNRMAGHTKDAINQAISNSNFVLPRNIGICDSIGISLVEGEFNNKEALDSFNVREFDKEDYNPFKNIIVLGGCKEPNWIFNEYAKEYQKKLDEDKFENIYDSDEDDIELELDFDRRHKNNKQETKSKPVNINTLKDIRSLYDDIC